MVYLASQGWIQAGITMRAGTSLDGLFEASLEYVNINAGETGSLVEQGDDLRLGQMVEDISPIAVGDDNTSFTQNHQMLRDAGLT